MQNCANAGIQSVTGSILQYPGNHNISSNSDGGNKFARIRRNK